MRGFLLAVLTLLTLGPSARAQDRAEPADSPRPTITIPEGTRLQTVLERDLTRRTSRPGSPIYLQLAHPVVERDTVAMPAGTYLEGVLDDVASKAGHFPADLRLHLSRLVYGNGYVLGAGTPAEGFAGEGVGDIPSPWASTAVFAGVALGIGLMGLSAAHAGVHVSPLLLFGPAVLFAPLAVGAHFGHPPLALDEGTPVELVLREPLVLDARRATAPGATALLPRPAARHERLCYSPGSPGTPDTEIPGTPATPPVVIPGAPGTPDVVIPGIPGTPPTVIPGMPGTPGSWYPCRH